MSNQKENRIRSKNRNHKYYIHASLSVYVKNEDIEEIIEQILKCDAYNWYFRVRVDGELAGEDMVEHFCRGGKLLFITIDKGDVYELTIPKLLTGIRLWIERKHHLYDDHDGHIMSGCIDTEEAEYILEYALFNETKFTLFGG